MDFNVQWTVTIYNVCYRLTPLWLSCLLALDGDESESRLLPLSPFCLSIDTRRSIRSNRHRNCKDKTIRNEIYSWCSLMPCETKVSDLNNFNHNNFALKYLKFPMFLASSWSTHTVNHRYLAQCMRKQRHRYR